MKRRGRMAWVILAVTILPVTGWLGTVAYLTRQYDRACLPSGNSSPRPEKRFVELQRILDTYSAEHGGVGLQATLIGPDGETWRGAAGYASHEKRCPLTLEHHLYIGSMTKLFTAALVMQQVEAGALNLDATIETWFDAPWASRVTLENLLHHTSGIPNYTEDAFFLLRYFGLPQKRWQPAELLAVIANRPLDFDPGSQHVYSNSNYLLLGMLLETATSKSYAQLLADSVRGEWGLANTHYIDLPAGLPIANAYDESLLRLGRLNLTGFRTSFERGGYAAGGIVSTSPDVAGLVNALFSGKIVSAATLARMTAFIPAPDADMPDQTGYGLGLRQLNIGGEIFAGHTGTIPGYSGVAMHNLNQGYTVAILSNQSIIQQVELLAAFQQVSRK
ncbi:MAG: serine hydrolase domain-containing protein [Chloroflexota bacterium]